MSRSCPASWTTFREPALARKADKKDRATKKDRTRRHGHFVTIAVYVAVQHNAEV
jgi:hypothetical protein